MINYFEYSVFHRFLICEKFVIVDFFKNRARTDYSLDYGICNILKNVDSNWDVTINLPGCGTAVTHDLNDIIFSSNFSTNSSTYELFYTQKFDYTFNCSYRREHSYVAQQLTVLGMDCKLRFLSR